MFTSCSETLRCRQNSAQVRSGARLGLALCPPCAVGRTTRRGALRTRSLSSQPRPHKGPGGPPRAASLLWCGTATPAWKAAVAMAKARTRSPTRSNGWVACLEMGAIGSLSSRTMARTRVRRARRAAEKFALGVPSLSAMKASSSWEWRSRVRLVLPSCLPEPALFSTRQTATPVSWRPLFGKARMSGNVQCLRRHNCHHYRP